MNGFRVFGLTLGFVLSVPLALPAAADATVPAAVSSAAPAVQTGKAIVLAKADADKDDESSKMGDADKRAKAIDCSKQADAKKLHGEARKKFRSACKRG